MKDKFHCPLCHRPVSGELEAELRERQRTAGKERWRGVSKRNISEEMKRVRRGEKKVALAA